jgi:hypothetical protein
MDVFQVEELLEQILLYVLDSKPLVAKDVWSTSLVGRRWNAILQPALVQRLKQECNHFVSVRWDLPWGYFAEGETYIRGRYYPLLFRLYVYLKGVANACILLAKADGRLDDRSAEELHSSSDWEPRALVFPRVVTPDSELDTFLKKLFSKREILKSSHLRPSVLDFILWDYHPDKDFWGAVAKRVTLYLKNAFLRIPADLLKAGMSVQSVVDADIGAHFCSPTGFLLRAIYKPQERFAKLYARTRWVSGLPAEKLTTLTLESYIDALQMFVNRPNSNPSAFH